MDSCKKDIILCTYYYTDKSYYISKFIIDIPLTKRYILSINRLLFTYILIIRIVESLNKISLFETFLKN